MFLKRVSVLIVVLISVMLASNFRVSAYFADIPPENSSYVDVQKIFERGIIDLGATENVTRAEVIAYIAKAVGLDGKPRNTIFKDVPQSHNYSGYIQSAVEAGIVSGYADGTFRPNENVTRGHVAVFITRAFKLPQIDELYAIKDVDSSHLSYQAIQQLYGLEITKGYADGTFRPQ